MFSSDTLIHLVFGDETDVYYCDDLLRLNLRQYLWRELCQDYPAVFFLRKAEKVFSVTCYGGAGSRYEPPSYGLWERIGERAGSIYRKTADKAISAQGKWLCRQLTGTGKERAAFV